MRLLRRIAAIYAIFSGPGDMGVSEATTAMAPLVKALSEGT